MLLIRLDSSFSVSALSTLVYATRLITKLILLLSIYFLIESCSLRFKSIELGK